MIVCTALVVSEALLPFRALAGGAEDRFAAMAADEDACPEIDCLVVGLKGASSTRTAAPAA